MAGKLNRLESDLIRAKAQIQKVLSGNAPSFVRAVGLVRNAAVNSIYSRFGRKHIVASQGNDVSRPTSQVVMQTLDSRRRTVREAIKAGAPHLIVDDEAERTLAETRAAMESGANHITEFCDAV